MFTEYAQILMEIRKAEAEAEQFGWFGNGPQGVGSGWPDGMPYRTNEPEAALLQREDLNEILDKIEDLYGKLEQCKNKTMEVRHRKTEEGKSEKQADSERNERSKVR